MDGRLNWRLREVVPPTGPDELFLELCAFRVPPVHANRLTWARERGRTDGAMSGYAYDERSEVRQGGGSGYSGSSQSEHSRDDRSGGYDSQSRHQEPQRDNRARVERGTLPQGPSHSQAGPNQGNSAEDPGRAGTGSDPLNMIFDQCCKWDGSVCPCSSWVPSED